MGWFSGLQASRADLLLPFIEVVSAKRLIDPSQAGHAAMQALAPQGHER